MHDFALVVKSINIYLVLYKLFILFFISVSLYITGSYKIMSKVAKIIYHKISLCVRVQIYYVAYASATNPFLHHWCTIALHLVPLLQREKSRYGELLSRIEKIDCFSHARWARRKTTSHDVEERPWIVFQFLKKKPVLGRFCKAARGIVSYIVCHRENDKREKGRDKFDEIYRRSGKSAKGRRKDSTVDTGEREACKFNGDVSR